MNKGCFWVQPDEFFYSATEVNDYIFSNSSLVKYGNFTKLCLNYSQVSRNSANLSLNC